MAQQDSPVLSPHLHAFPTSCLLLGTHRYSSSFSVLWQGGVNGGRLVVYLQRPAWGGPHHTSLSGSGRKSSRTQHMLHAAATVAEIRAAVAGQQRAGRRQ